MKLATLRTAPGHHRAVRVDGRHAVELGARRRRRAARRTRLADRGGEPPPGARPPARRRSDYAPLVPAPGKIICVGLNYRNHIMEMGRELPEYPTLFAKFADALIGAHDDIVLPAESRRGRLGGRARRRDRQRRSGTPTRPQAEAAIAGYTVLNDVTRARLPVPHARSGCRARPSSTPPRSARTWSPPTSCPRAAGHRAPRSTARRRAEPPTRPTSCSARRPGRLHLADRHAEPRRRHRHRHAGRRRPRPQAPALPEGRARLVTTIEGLGEQRNILVTGGTGA